MTVIHDADGNVTLGVVHDHEGLARTVFRDFDEFVAPSMTCRPAGVRELEARIVDYWNALARYRLRTLDFDDFCINDDDLEEARDDLTGIPGLADPSEPHNLELADWVEVGRRLLAMRAHGGYDQLRRLHSLLSCDDPEAWCGCAVSGWNVLPVACHVHGVACDECGGLAACKPGCGNEGLPLVES